jgi:S-adenosylmethionine hydrolase
VFAPTAGRLAAGWAADGAGRPHEALASLPLATSGALEQGGAAEVVHVDAFGNIFTSFQGGAVPPGSWELELDGRRFPLVAGRTFSDAPPGALVLYPGSGGQIEIAVRDGSAAALTGARRGTALVLRRMP